MDLHVSHRGYNNSFCGLLGKEKFDDIKVEGSGAREERVQFYFPFQDEPDKEIDAAIKKRSGQRASVINGNGIGTVIKNVKVMQGPRLPIKAEEYNTYKYSTPAMSLIEKVENALIENGLTHHLKKGGLSSRLNIRV